MTSPCQILAEQILKEDPSAAEKITELVSNRARAEYLPVLFALRHLRKQNSPSKFIGELMRNILNEHLSSGQNDPALIGSILAVITLYNRSAISGAISSVFKSHDDARIVFEFVLATHIEK